MPSTMETFVFTKICPLFLLALVPLLASADSNDLLTRMEKLEGHFSGHSQKINILEGIIDTLKVEVKNLKLENFHLRHSNALDKVYQHLGTDYRKMSKRLLVGSETVDQYGFYAYMSHDEPEPGGHHIFVYDVAETNVGHAYNNFTGIFTIPQDGLYSFTWSTRVQCSKAHTTELVLNMKILGSTYAYCGWNTVTGHVVTRASQGDAVFVRTHGTPPGQGAVKSDEFGRSAFSGFLIA